MIHPCPDRMSPNKALQPTPLGIGAAYGGHAPCGAVTTFRWTGAERTIYALSATGKTTGRMWIGLMTTRVQIT